MCGIVLVYGKNTKSLCKSMIEKINYRGPDNTTYYSNELFSLGFVRLAINDFSNKGHQPYEYEDLVSVTNGEIYNHKELKIKYQFKDSGDCDTHIIPKLFKKKGFKLISELDGFYSTLIWNKKQQKLYSFRDYIGKKNLFLVKTKENIMITSELKIVNDCVDFLIIPKGVCEIFLADFSYKQIVNHNNNPIEPSDNLKNILVKSVRKRIPNKHHKFGVFLSGGLDSSIIYNIVKKQTSNVVFYTLGNIINSTDVKYVKSLISHDNNKFKFIPLPTEQELIALISKTVYITESYNPSVISNGICSYLLSKEANKDGIKVVLSGEGADELFGGYHMFKENNDQWKTTRFNLINDLYLTELRRIDLTTMYNSIEIRCPFLDKEVYNFSNNLQYRDLYNFKEGVLYNKYVLRNAFEDCLPHEIVFRSKTSSDVGSGIRKLVVEYLTKDGLTERQALKKIWSKIFNFPADNSYFHSYPVFNKIIDKRGIKHKHE